MVSSVATEKISSDTTGNRPRSHSTNHYAIPDPSYTLQDMLIN